MKDIKINRKKFLKALIGYAEKSENFNPHFYKKEMMDTLKITERDFNIIQNNLGKEYCYYVDSHGDCDRYAINVSKCLALQEQHDQEDINEKRHRLIVRLAILVAILGAVLGVALNIWLTKS